MKWLELAHDKKVYLYPTFLYWLCAQYACKKMGVKNNIIGCWYKDHEFSYLTTPGGLAKAGKMILAKLEKSDLLLRQIEQVNTREIPIMLKAAEKLTGDLSRFSYQELYKRWQDWLKKFISMMTYSVLGTVMEMEKPLLSNKVGQILKDKLKNNPAKISEYFQVLTISPRVAISQKEEIDLLKLRLKQFKGELKNNDLQKHLKNYNFLGWGYNGPAWDETDIKNRLKLLPKSSSAVLKTIKEKSEHGKKLNKIQKKIEQELGLNVKEQRLFNALRTLGFWKFERKFLNQKAHVLMHDFIKEIARRNHISIIQALMIAPNEYSAALEGKVDMNLLNERIKECIVIFKGINYQILSGTKAKRELENLRKSLAVDKKIKEIKGDTAYPGFSRGVVRRVDTAEDIKKMNKGDILVSTSTNPQVVPAMQKASAIVTDSGGITCHAAIISRELKKPCVIGTKIATKILKDGDLVEVNANKGIIKKL